MAGRVREAGTWLLLRAGLLLATPMVLLDLGASNPLVWGLLLVFLHVVFAVRNAGRARGLVRNHLMGPVDWPVVQWSVALCAVGLLLYGWHTTTHVMALARVTTADMTPTLEPGDWVLLDLRERKVMTGDIVQHRCASGEPGCIHRIHALGPTRVEPVDNQQPQPVAVPDHWVFIRGDNAAQSVDSRQLGPMPPTNITARVLPL